jgi:hypothetical protein
MTIATFHIMLFTKIAAAAAFLVTVSAEWESICIQGKTANLISNNKYQTAVCLSVSLASVQDKWGGGRSHCNDGTYQVYWNVASNGETWLCYGSTSSCKHIKATKDDPLAKKRGYDKCWSVNTQF